MFDLEKAIADWRQRMVAAGLKTPVPLAELESHLRDEIERQVKAGLNEPQAFAVAVRELGQPAALKNEFQRAGANDWHHPVAWAAWGAFALSFGLPACGFWGWQCACISAEAAFWPETWHDWADIHITLLTLANLLMLASPFWLPRYSANPRAMKWLRGAGFVALALVWSWVLRAIISEAGAWKELQAGGYLWAVSFILLFRATFPRRKEKAQYV
jgi:hypothetical protein